MPASHFDGMMARGNVVNRTLRMVLVMLVFSCVFDPADKLFHLKIPLFVLVWLVFVVKHLCDREAVTFPLSMVLYFMLFSCVFPVVSIVNYSFSSQLPTEYDGFGYLKAYFFLSLIFILFIEGIDLLKALSVVMTLLTIATLAVLIAVKCDVVSLDDLMKYGQDYGMLVIGWRSYGGYYYTTYDFVASPLLVMSIAYFTDLFMKNQGFKKMGIFIVLAMNIATMLVVGTRSGTIIAIVIPFAVWFAYAKRKRRVILLLSALLLVAAIVLKDALLDALSLQETSNSMKLSLFGDYSVVFDNVKNLLVGQGLGARFFVSARGEYHSVSELTYIELIRNYGLFVAGVYYLLLAFPFVRYRSYRSAWYVLIAYACYLLMSSVNPLLFSSTGMLALSIVLCVAFLRPPDAVMVESRS